MTVYFIEAKETGYIKIGYSADVGERMRSLKYTTKLTLTLLRTVEGDRRVERWFHARFIERSVTGEWFERDEEMFTVVPPADLSVLNFRVPSAKTRDIGRLIARGEFKASDYAPPFVVTLTTSDGLLSAREVEVAQLVTSGLSNKVIARRLGISGRTVEVHVASALEKLDLPNRAQLALWAIHVGIVVINPIVKAKAA